MKLPRYPKYKDSGVEWLGEVPEHWETKRAKFLFMLMRRPALDDDGIVTAFRDGQVTLRTNRRTDGFTNAEKEIGYQGVRAGDLVIHAMDAFAGAVGVSDADGKCSPVYSCCSAKAGTLVHFYARIVRTMALTGFIESLSRGIRERSTDFRWREFAEQKLPVPPIDEQEKLNYFLDRETSKINALIDDQLRLIELLKEKRQAVLSQAVTKGLNPNAPMKPSGIDWLGDVPTHWTPLRVKHITNFVTSGPRGWAEFVSESGDIFVQSGDLDDEMNISFANCKRVQVQNSAETSRTLLRNGDVVVCITGAKTGNVAICESVHESAYVNQHLCLIRPNEKVLPRFLSFALKSWIGQSHFALSQYGLKQGLGLEDIKETPVMVPPASEQEEIVAFLDSEGNRLRRAREFAEKAIQLLQERRSALISAAVTGKIDIRGLTSTEAA